MENETRLSFKNTTKIEYQDSLCAFIDILGFSAMVKSQHSKIGEYFDVINQFKKNYDHSSDIKMLAISDSIIFTMKLESDDELNRKTFRFKLQLISSLQMLLANMGLWTRGGIATGGLFFNQEENIIVGDAFIKAIEIEKIAKFPRIVIDNEITTKLGFSNVREMIEGMNKVKAISGPEAQSEVIYDYKKHLISSHRANEIVIDRPMIVDFAAVLAAIKDEHFLPPFYKHLQEDMTKRLEHFEKYRWLSNYMSIKLRTITEFGGNRSYRDIAYHLENII